MPHKLWSSLTRHPWWAALAVVALLGVLPLLSVPLAWAARIVLLVLFLAVGTRVFTKLRASAQNPKPAIFGLAALFFGLGFAYGLAELVSWAYIKRVPLSGDPFVLTERQKKFVQMVVTGAVGYEVYSPSLGWTIGKNQVSKDGLYRSNADGFRADREYSKENPPGKLRVLCFGDSYTHGDEVGNQETWEHYAEKKAPDMEFLNFGVPGYSLTQAYVRYKEVASSYKTDYVIIGCMTEDLKRGVNVYYPFRYPNPEDSPNAAAMPYAALDDEGELVIHPPAIASREEYAAFLENPLPVLKRMARMDLLFRPQPPTPLLALLADRWEGLDGRLDPAVDYALESWHLAFHSGGDFKSLRYREALRNGERRRRIAEVSRRMFQRFVLEVEKNGAVPLIVWFPSPTNLDQHNEGKKRDYAPYFDFFKERGLVAVDTLDWLEEIGGKGKPLAVKSLLTGVHFSAATNSHVGGRLVDFIRADARAPKLE